MKNHLLASTVLTLLTCTIPVFGEIVQFGPAPPAGLTPLRYDDIQPGVQARDLFLRWGVWRDGEDSIPEVMVLPVPTPTCVSVPGLYLVNRPVSGNSAGKPMIIDSRFPLHRIAFELRTDRGDTEATLDVFDSRGVLLGTLVFNSFSAGCSGGYGGFVGLESTDGGMSKIVIDYGAIEEPEQLGAPIVEFASEMRYVLFLPQIGNGRVSSGPSLSTSINIIGLSAGVTGGSVDFFDSSGEPLVLSFDDGFSGSSREFSVDSNPVTWMTVPTQGDLVTGYARIESHGPVQSTAILKTWDAQGKLIGQAGIAADSPRVLSRVFALGTAASRTGSPLTLEPPANTGIAVSNVSAEDTDVKIVVTYSSKAGDSASLTKSVSLAPGAHVAQFVSDYFPELINISFTGTVLVSSIQPLAVTALQTSDGVAVSSLPAAGIQP